MVSEAILCAGKEAPKVVDWAFKNQEDLRNMAAEDPAKLKTEIGRAFPSLKRCVGSKGVQHKLNKSLRWAVKNRLPVLTPQLYVEGRKLCDEDTDLGMDFALSRLLEELDGKSALDVEGRR